MPPQHITTRPERARRLTRIHHTQEQINQQMGPIVQAIKQQLRKYYRAMVAHSMDKDGFRALIELPDLVVDFTPLPRGHKRTGIDPFDPFLDAQTGLLTITLPTSANRTTWESQENIITQISELLTLNTAELGTLIHLIESCCRGKHLTLQRVQVGTSKPNTLSFEAMPVAAIPANRQHHYPGITHIIPDFETESGPSTPPQRNNLSA